MLKLPSVITVQWNTDGTVFLLLLTFFFTAVRTRLQDLNSVRRKVSFSRKEEEQVDQQVSPVTSHVKAFSGLRLRPTHDDRVNCLVLIHWADTVTKISYVFSRVTADELSGLVCEEVAGWLYVEGCCPSVRFITLLVNRWRHTLLVFKVKLR